MPIALAGARAWTLFRKTSVMSGFVRDASAVKPGAAPKGANRRIPLHDVKDPGTPSQAQWGPRLRPIADAMGTPGLRCPRHRNLMDEPDAGGARRDRTDDLLLAKQALSQLSYGPLGTPSCKHDGDPG